MQAPAKESANAGNTDITTSESREETGIALISAERARQVSAEGWTPEHDDAHDLDQMRLAAVAYAYHINSYYSDDNEIKPPPRMWPWGAKWWKPSRNPVRQLVKAGALIAAEIDRLLRARSQGAENELWEARGKEHAEK